VVALVRHLAAAGHSSWVATPPRGELAARLTKGGDAPVAALTCAFGHDPRAGLALRRWLVQLEFDLVHLHTGRALTLAPYLPREIARVVTRRMDYRPRGSGAYVRWLYRQVDAVIAISRAARDALVARGVAAERIVIVPSGVAVEEFAGLDRARARRQLGLEESGRVAAIIGSLHRRKGHEVLLAALARLAAQGRAPVLLAAGDGPERARLEAAAATAGVADRVRWLGRCADVRPVLAAADVVVAPSLAEGLGVAAIEALAASRPVVASAVGGLAELVRDGREGILVPAGDDGALAAALDRVLSDAAFRARLATGAQQRARAYSTAAMARGTEAVYERAVAARARA
jgi:glycosyltransferase involved in cell wall biosynthesis